MNKLDLLKQFRELAVIKENNNCNNCNNCYNCNYCNNCTNCTNCNDCNDCYSCILCKNLSYKAKGYWLLNQEVTKEEFNKAKKALGYK